MRLLSAADRLEGRLREGAATTIVNQLDQRTWRRGDVVFVVLCFFRFKICQLNRRWTGRAFEFLWRLAFVLRSWVFDL